MARSICQSLLDTLAEAGAREVFGITGDVINPLLEAIRNDDRFRWIGVRHEEHAAYAAAAQSELTGKVGVCEGPSGGGATYILPGVVEANESSIALLSITSDVSVTSQGRYPLTELRQDELFRPLTKYNGVIVLGGPMNCDQADRYPHLTTEIEAIRAAIEGGIPVLGICLGAQLIARRCQDRRLLALGEQLEGLIDAGPRVLED